MSTHSKFTPDFLRKSGEKVSRGHLDLRCLRVGRVGLTSLFCIGLYELATELGEAILDRVSLGKGPWAAMGLRGWGLDPRKP